MILVVNASPLIVLSKAGLIDLILGLATELIIPEPVAHEISQAKDPTDPAKSWLARQASLLTETLGIILTAKPRGVLTAVKPALDAVVAAGLFISPAHIHAVLAKAGEAR